MIVLGADTHMRSYTLCAVCAQTGRRVAEKTVGADRDSHERLLLWARGLGEDRVWAVEDCRNVSGKLERLLLGRGERVIRVAPSLMAARRRSGRTAGKSDAIDALAIARAAVAEGIDQLPVAQLDGPAREIKLLLDHREDLVGERTRIQNRLRWLAHDRWPELTLRPGALSSQVAVRRLQRKLHGHHGADVRVMRDQLRRLGELNRACKDLTAELAELVAAQQPRLLLLPGVGTLTAAKLICEIAGIERFASVAKLARMAGVAPIPASSGAQHRQRLHRGGNRQLNAALHRIAVTQARHHPPAQAYLARKHAEGKTKREAIRCLKRQLVRTVYRAMLPIETTPLLT